MDGPGETAEWATGQQTADLSEVSYDAYADRVHTYCLSLLRDHDAAAEATWRAFVVAAAHVGRVRDRAKTRAWLYTLARNECLGAGGRPPAPVPPPASLTAQDAVGSLERDLRRAELAALSWARVDGLDPCHREVLELSARHRLEVADIALIIEQEPAAARSLLDTAWHGWKRGALADAVGKQQSWHCRELAAVLELWDGRVNALTRSRILRHLDDCGRCKGAAADELGRISVPSVFPLVPAPRALRERVLTPPRSRRERRAHARLARRAGPFDPAGFPARRQPERPRRPLSERRKWALVAASMALVVGGGLAFGQLYGGGRAGSAAAGPTDGITGLRLRDGAVSGQAGAPPAAGGAATDLASGAGRGSHERAQTSAASRRALGGAAAGDWADGMPALASDGLARPVPGVGSSPGAEADAASAGAAATVPSAGGGPAGSGPSGPSGPSADRHPASAHGADGTSDRSGELRVTATPVSRTVVRITLAPTGDAPVAWRATSSAAFLRLSRQSGVIRPGQTQQITASVASDATPAGDWSATITFRPGDATLTMSGHTDRRHRRHGDGGGRSAPDQRPARRAGAAGR